MSRHPQPPVLRSWEHLRNSQGIPAAAALPITAEGTTYVMAQELTWVDSEHFAVGRWDGSMSLFQFSSSSTTGPVIVQAVNAPSSEGVQMITWLAPGRFVTSNDAASCTVWRSASGQWGDLTAESSLQYSVALGVANSGASYVSMDGSTCYLLVGHANGYVTIWSGHADGSQLALQSTLNLQVSQPLNPWGLQNVRGISLIYYDDQYGYFVAGGENGYLSVVRAPDGAVLSSTPYNPAAQRGINSLATLRQNLLVANCMVGSGDYNLWYYWVDSSSWAIQKRDAAKLQVNQSLAQVFNFDVIWGYYNQGLCWFAATEEGYLWMGSIQDNQSLQVLGNQQFTGALGAAIGMSVSGNLAAAAYDLYEFNTTPNGAAVADGGHPSRWRTGPPR